MAGIKEATVIEVKQLRDVSEFNEAVRVQREVWGFDDIDLLPTRLFVVASKVGGQTLGAFDGNKMVGFLLAVPGLKPGGKGFLHSHMMGVLADYRNLKVGRMLKLKQREEALERGIDLVEWTFDPLELKNAYFNIEKLGAIVRRYVLNQYGITSSFLQAGLPTDRCVAEWWIAKDRAPQNITERIEVPTIIAEWKKNDVPRAREVQKRVSDSFMNFFSKGLAVLAFERGDENCSYLLGPYEE